MHKDLRGLRVTKGLKDLPELLVHKDRKAHRG